MSGWTAAALATGLAAASACCLVGLPRSAGQRLAGLDLGPDMPSGQAVRWGWGTPAARQARFLAGATVAVGVLVLGPVVALLGVAAAALARRTHGRRQHAAALREERRRAVEACGALVGELRAGRTPAHALAAAAELASGPSREALCSAAAAAQLGGDVAAALSSGSAGNRQLAGGRGSAGRETTAVPELLRALAACWTVCSVSGSGLAAAVDRLEEGLRAEQARRRAVDAELAGPRATAGMLAVLPLAGMLLATGLGADPVAMLLHTPLGLVCLSGGLLLDALGLWWTARLVARAGRAV